MMKALQLYADYNPSSPPPPPPYMPLPSGERVPAFERVLEVSPGEADKLSNMMKYYKKMGYVRADRRLYGLVKKYHHKDKVHMSV